jgi:hypothetical protein
VTLMADYAYRELAATSVLLLIAPGNAASEAVARATGFRLTDEEPVLRGSEGQQTQLLTWSRHAGPSAPPAARHRAASVDD